MTFLEFSNYLYSMYPDPSTRGRIFERVMVKFFKADPMFNSEIKQIWQWRDFPYKQSLSRDLNDIGIDIVVLTHNDKYWAIQVKFYANETTIYKEDVDTFLSTSGRAFGVLPTLNKFDKRIWVSTSDALTKKADECLTNQTPPVFRINRAILENSGVDWEVLLKDGPVVDAMPVKHKLNKFQLEAIQSASEHFKTNDRGKMIMACGTGKTITSLRIAEKLATTNKLILFCVPSISLIAQSLRQWVNQANGYLNKICVCSDESVTVIDNQSDHIINQINDLPYPATTDATTLYKTYLELDKSKLTVVFTTYQSIDVIMEAQEIGLPEFDIIICDEAHRTAGVIRSHSKTSSFVKVHDNAFIKGSLRLYMTATPRLYNTSTKERAEYKDTILCSMDDPSIFGTQFYKLSFRKAVEEGLLCDYKVLVLTIKEDDPDYISLKRYYNVDKLVQDNIEIARDVKKEFTSIVKIIGSRKALSKKIHGDDSVIREDPKAMLSAVAYCDTLKTTRQIVDQYKTGIDNIDENEDLMDIECERIDGMMSSNLREKKLNWLKNDAEEITDKPVCRILTNVRCLSEGIDVPALDAIIFLAGKNSQIEVVQSVGRVMRQSKGKAFGYIIIPIIVPLGMSAEKALEKSEEYQVVASVVSALRAHDENMDSTIIQIASNKKKPKRIIIVGTSPDKDTQLLNLDDLLNQCTIKDLSNVIYGRLVASLNLKLHWTRWAVDVANIVDKHIKLLTEISQNAGCKKLFDIFIEKLRNSTNNPNLTIRAVIEMLSQHKVTQPIFNALFNDYEFARHNPISIELNSFLDKIDKLVTFDELRDLNDFYDSIKRRASGIDNLEGKQNVIIELYNTFFKTAFPDMTKELGIVYTPIEIVDFIIHSVSDILNNEFGRALTDESVTILDPFTGTGTFITRLLQSGLIRPIDMERKFRKELFAYEIVLLAYYIATINIENTYHDIMNAVDYTPFEGICFTDTFQLN
ncbi:MAG: DEAD/DEAH box helicase family protein, partial [Christensenellaceae bacterium]|nr:DEAD/DEAH box helicase family protein [Christensenellaceae bacterium]